MVSPLQFNHCLNVNFLSGGNHRIRLQSLVAKLEIPSQTGADVGSKDNDRKQRQFCELSNRPVQSSPPSRHIRRRISCNLPGSVHTFKSGKHCAGSGRDSLWIVCELLRERIEGARPGCIRIEAGRRLPRAVRTTKFDPALAVRPLVAGGGAHPLLLPLRWAPFHRTPCWRRWRGWARWSRLVGRDAEDD